MDYGTTAALCIVADGYLAVAHVGDSPVCVFSRPVVGAHSNGGRRRAAAGEWQLAYRTVDHRPKGSEAKRVLAEGGKVKRIGADLRVFPRSMTFAEARGRQLTLNMSRALGHVAMNKAGISAEPDVCHLPLEPGQEYLLLCMSDGVSEVMEDQVSNTSQLFGVLPRPYAQSPPRAQELSRMFSRATSGPDLCTIALAALHTCESRWR